MVKATANDKPLVVALLAKAFNGHNSVNYLLGADNTGAKYLNALMEFSFEMCYKFGDIWLSDDGKACALIFYPQKKRVSLKLSLLKIRLLLSAITSGDYKSRRHHLAAMKKMRPNLDMALIWYIGVDPNYQNRGIGTRLITQVLQRIKSCSLPVYLELSAYQYLGWFERFGFEGYEVYDCADYKFVNFFLKNDLK